MPSTHLSLLARLADPEEAAAWREFDRRYGPMIVGYCLRRGLQLFDAEDVRQIVLASLSRSMRGFEYRPERGRFRDYLGRVVANAVSRFKGRHAGLPGCLSAEVADGLAADSRGEGAADMEWERAWVRRHCQLAMERLRETESRRDVEVFERLLAGCPSRQVADEVGLTEEAVRKIKQRVRERLRAFLEERINDEEKPRDTRPPTTNS